MANAFRTLTWFKCMFGIEKAIYLIKIYITSINKCLQSIIKLYFIEVTKSIFVYPILIMNILLTFFSRFISFCTLDTMHREEGCLMRFLIHIPRIEEMESFPGFLQEPSTDLKEVLSLVDQAHILGHQTGKDSSHDRVAPCTQESLYLCSCLVGPFSYLDLKVPGIQVVEQADSEFQVLDSSQDTLLLFHILVDSQGMMDTPSACFMPLVHYRKGLGIFYVLPKALQDQEQKPELQVVVACNRKVAILRNSNPVHRLRIILATHIWLEVYHL